MWRARQAASQPAQRLRLFEGVCAPCDLVVSSTCWYSSWVAPADVLAALVVYVLPPSFLAVFLLVFLRDLRRATRPIQLINQGRFSEARALCEKPWWLNWLPSVRLTCQYNMALCLMFEGRLEESLTRFQQLSDASLPGNLREAVANALGTNLLLLDREPELARHWLSRACGSLATASDHMSLALALQRAGDSNAPAQVARAEATADRRLTLGVKVVLVHGKELEDSCFALMRGLYRLERDQGDARADLERAAASSVQSVYQTTARRYLEDLPAIQPVETEPSSLAPHILAGR